MKNLPFSIVLIYFLTALLWASAWIPFSYGYYGLPWGYPSFELKMKIFAWTHLICGVLLILFSFKSNKLLVLNGTAILLSAFSIWRMYAWMHAWHH